jgi:hypothetical protein
MAHARNSFLVFLLAMTIILPSLTTHAAGSPRAVSVSSEDASIHPSSKCALTIGIGDSGDSCAVAASHCLMAYCAPYDLSQPWTIQFDVSHPALNVPPYRVFAAIEVPPPRAEGTSKA